MSAAAKLLTFVVVLAAVGVGAAAAGSAIDPDAPGGDDPVAATHTGVEEAAHGHAAEDTAPAHEDEHAGGEEHALSLDLATTTFAAGERGDLRFRILDVSGTPVTDFAVEHEKRMHVIVVRKDLTGFQHLHPEMDDDGTWRVPLTLAEAGDYRVYADFAEGTLHGDVSVPGDAHTHALPPARQTAEAGDGYVVKLGGGEKARRGEEVELPFTVQRNGAQVDVEPYLGADGHLVAISEGELEFLHVHPMDGAFMATFPKAGNYRLFLQFKHRGEVRTAEFTQVVP